MSDFTHFNEQGRARMVDVGEKPVTQRTAAAAGRVLVNEKTFSLIKSGGMKKGDVLTVAQIAGVMGAKRTPDIIPMCHPILMDGINLELSLDEARKSVEIKATVSCDGRVTCETHIIDYSGILYGKEIKVDFYRRIRDEKRFSSVEELLNIDGIGEKTLEKLRPYITVG